MKTTPLITFFIAVALSVVPAAFAVPKYYEIGNASSVDAFSDPEPPFALVVHTALSPTLTGTNFILDDGQSFTFSFFDIWTDETHVNPDDTVPQNITATLDFFVPSVDPSIGGNTVGTSIFYGIIQYGQVTWNGPAIVTIPGDRQFSVTLSDEHFNFGFFGLNEGEKYGATVEATVEQITSSNAVPETANTAMLFGAALVGVAFMARKRTIA